MSRPCDPRRPPRMAGPHGHQRARSRPAPGCCAWDIPRLGDRHQPHHGQADPDQQDGGAGVRGTGCWGGGVDQIGAHPPIGLDSPARARNTPGPGIKTRAEEGAPQGHAARCAQKGSGRSRYKKKKCSCQRKAGKGKGRKATEACQAASKAWKAKPLHAGTGRPDMRAHR